MVQPVEKQHHFKINIILDDTDILFDFYILMNHASLNVELV